MMRGSLRRKAVGAGRVGERMSYLRMTIGRWTIDLDSAEGAEVFRRIEEEGGAVFRRQPGFIQYRLMKADGRTTVAVAEWESEELGKPGAMNYRAWLKESGIKDKLTLETLDGNVVASA
jgi:heme-degrading monooxygenase HmoA